MTFEALYNKTYKYAYTFFASRIHDRGHIDDLCQTVYLRFYIKYKDQTEFTDESIKILFGFYRNIYKEHVRKATKNKELPLIENYDHSQEAELTEHSTPVQQQLEKQKELIRQALPKLNKNVRAVIEYKFFYQMKHAEIATLLSLSESSILKYQQRGIKYLQNIIKDM